MKIKDIVNRDIVNLDNCEQEPIHIPGSIQPHGFLIGITASGFLIDFCSANTDEYIAMGHAELLGKKFSEVFGSDREASLKAYIDNNSSSSVLFSFIFRDKKFSCNVHLSHDVYILEAEPDMEVETYLPDTYEQTRRFLSYMQETTSLQGLCASVANGIREFTGYDRVMIYRFDEDYNGEIFAESKRDDLEPFFGLHYPHTDIPVQARELYIRNLLRLIVDINYTPVSLYTIDNKENKNLDLSLSTLRSTSPIHVQYLANMGVGGTLTISLLHNGRLWGLIACHHYSAKNLSPATRLAAQLQGHFITSQIDVRQSNEEYDIARRSNDALESLLAIDLGANRDSFEDIVNNDHVLHLCNASGVAIIAGDRVYRRGVTPTEDELIFIAGKAAELSSNTGFSSHHLLADIGEGCCGNDVAGMIYHPLRMSGEDCIMWFRGETISEVTWAGDPSKAIVKDEKGLHPRKSFSQWKEIVKNKSTPWMAPELNAAANYAHVIEKHVTLLVLAEEEEKYRKLSVVLKASNEELENVNWISAHDLQEPLRKIQMMSSRILSTEEESLTPVTNDLLNRMNASAHKMQSLLRSILDFVKIKNTERLMEPVLLNKIVEEVILELDEQVNERSAKITISELPEIHAIPFLVKQLFVNIISNSLKFSSEDRPQLIDISAAVVPGPEVGEPESNRFHKVSIADTGIGFNDSYSDSIFKIFSRLHTGTEYQGSGVGLALCRKIMQAHDGYISASGKEGEGATFHLYFPVGS
jgi:chemotaxis family two-component system sensor kinase Cph1